MNKHRLLFLISLVSIIAICYGNWSCSDAEISPTGPPIDHSLRFLKISGDSQFCDSMDTLDFRFVVQLDTGVGFPVTGEYLRFKKIEGNGQTVVKPSGVNNPAEVRVPTNHLGQAKVNFQCFWTCQAKVRVTVESMPEIQVEFIVNQGVVCPTQ